MTDILMMKTEPKIDGHEHRYPGHQWVSMNERGSEVAYTDNYHVARNWCKEKPNRSWSFCPAIYLQNRKLKYYE